VNDALAGKHALVTGGGRGIGAAISAALITHGARVTLLGRDRARLEATAETLPRQVSFVIADITEHSAVVAAFAAARERSGDIDILINNAGQATSAPLHKTDTALFTRMLAVNLTGAYHCTCEAAPPMIARRYGRIVNVASTAGLVGYAYCAAYCAAKHGVVGLTRALALEFATHNITVNAVCPGYTDTDIVRDAVANIVKNTGRSETEAVAALVANNPQKRLVQPAEVANAVLWLCLPGAESMTGQSLVVAGGEVT
jgi:NAD(P)-dependent dehydrogenase (short-subunit alcohol dehydrogenase family)